MNPGREPGPAKQPGQLTFSTIGDVHIAVENGLQRQARSADRTGWAGIGVYTLLAYLAGLAALLSLDAPPRAPALFEIPLAAAGVCLAAAWSRARWKAHVRSAHAGLKAMRKAMDSLAHETAAGLDVIRAQWLSLQTVKLDDAGAAHFSLLSRGAGRIGAALERFNTTQLR
jgi:hypothetical protein